MNITISWLASHSACIEGRTWFYSQKETDAVKVLSALVKDGKYEWANWTITKLLSHRQNVLYACYVAKQSLHLFEKHSPQDRRPRKAILAAMKWAKFPNEINRSAAESAWLAAEPAAWLAEESAAWLAAESAAAKLAMWKKIMRCGVKLLKQQEPK